MTDKRRRNPSLSYSTAENAMDQVTTRSAVPAASTVEDTPKQKTHDTIAARDAGLQAAETDGFHLVIDALRLNGIDTIFGLPGIPITDFTRKAQAAGMRVISFRHEQSAGYAASIAGYLTQKPGVCLTVCAPGFLNGLTALANATTNCFPLILLGKGAAYAQADADIRALVEKTGIPYVPMSMAKGLLPDTHEQSAAAARSYVLPEADVVMLIGARLNWLLSHGKGKTWGGKSAKDWGGQQFIQIDISPQEADSNVRIDAPVVGDIGSCVSALLAAIGTNWPKPPSEWLDAIAERRNKNVGKMAEALAKNPTPMNFHSALNVVRDIIKANPDAILVNEGANALDFTRSIVDMYKPRKRLDVGTWGVMGVGMGFSVAAAVVSGEQVIAVEGDSAFGFSGMECETICRYNLPVCVVILNNNGVYRGDEVNPSGGSDPSPLVFVKGARYEKPMEAFGGVGVLATTPTELRNAMEEAIRSGRPTLINAVIDEKAGTESGRITSLNPAAKKKP